MKRTISLLFATLTGLVVSIPISSAPAQAGWPCDLTGQQWCGLIKHYSPDDGLDSDIGIRCKFGDPSSTHWLAEGESSRKYCVDTDQVFVGNNQEIWCKFYVYSPGDYDETVWLRQFDAQGWHKITDIRDLGIGCTKRED